MSQTLTPALRQWLVEQASAGCTPESVLQAMQAAGWQSEVAIDAMEQVLAEHLASQGLTPSPPPPMPDLDLSCAPSQIEVDGHTVRVQTVLGQPRMVVLGNLLSPAECQGLIDLAAPRLARSKTVQVATGGEEANPDRTSQGMFFERAEHPLIERIEARIAALLRWPVSHGEGLQVLHYSVGAQYKPHYDYFEPEASGSGVILQRGGQRVATLVMYLNEPQAGGATVFPDIGLEVAPQLGSAVFFSYDRPHPSTLSLHGGAPVLAGEKWVATKWLRQGEFV